MPRRKGRGSRSAKWRSSSSCCAQRLSCEKRDKESRHFVPHKEMCRSLAITPQEEPGGKEEEDDEAICFQQVAVPETEAGPSVPNVGDLLACSLRLQKELVELDEQCTRAKRSCSSTRDESE